MLFADGQDLRAMLLQARKKVLKRLLADRPGLLVMDGITGEGSRLFKAVCELDLEGIVAKRKSEPVCAGNDTEPGIQPEGRAGGAV